ncbi:MAG: hypothetical protein F7B18_04470 [Desulfurococcales archaeon]|nr:hypothetical protein [Desulfurococcales archaeon]
MSRRDDVEELKEVLSVVADFLDQLSSKLKMILDSVMETLDGAKIGKEVGDMYKSLKEAGVPEEVAIEMTKEFFRKKMELAPSLSSLFQSIGGGWRSGGKPAKEALEEALDQVEEALEGMPEDVKAKARRRIERALEDMRSGEGNEE